MGYVSGEVLAGFWMNLQRAVVGSCLFSDERRHARKPVLHSFSYFKNQKGILIQHMCS